MSKTWLPGFIFVLAGCPSSGNGPDARLHFDSGPDGTPGAIDGGGTDAAPADAGVALTNGCDPATAVDDTGMAAVTVMFAGGLGFNYSPKCFKISAGTMVTFQAGTMANFNQHPLVGGTIVGAMKNPDPASPFAPTTTMGTSKTFTLGTAGTFGFYCDVHGPSGMNGAVFVQ